MNKKKASHWMMKLRNSWTYLAGLLPVEVLSHESRGIMLNHVFSGLGGLAAMKPPFKSLPALLPLEEVTELVHVLAP